MSEFRNERHVALASRQADLDRNFLDFKAFAEGDPEFGAGQWTQRHRFLSFVEFVEEIGPHT